MNNCIDCKKKISNGHKRCKSCENIRRHKSGIINNKGVNHCFFGEKRIEHSKRMTGKSNPMFGKKRPDLSYFNTYIRDLSGTNNPNYRDGKGNYPYSIVFSRKLKRLIRERDRYICQNCYKRGKHVHHIDYDKDNCKENNLITLCRKCHGITNFSRDYWKKKLQSRVDRIIEIMTTSTISSYEEEKFHKSKLMKS